MTRHPGTSAQHLVGCVFICLRRTLYSDAASRRWTFFASNGGSPTSSRRTVFPSEGSSNFNMLPLADLLLWGNALFPSAV